MTELSTTPSSNPFDAIRHEDEQGEYWLSEELMTTLGYDDKSNFVATLEKAKTSCTNAGGNVALNFGDVAKKSVGRGRPPKDLYRLTRYACYLIAQNADPNKEVVAIAQTYFAVMTRAAELQQLNLMEARLAGLAAQIDGDALAEVAHRIALREELSEANKALLQQAYEAGVITKRQLAMFMNMGYKGLYAQRTEDDLHTLRGLKPSQHISDYMSALETFANYLRALIGKRNIQVRQVGTARAAGIAHYDAGQQVRDMLLHSVGIAPEDLPRPTKSYRQIVKEAYVRIQREEEAERGLWGQLPDADTP